MFRSTFSNFQEQIQFSEQRQPVSREMFMKNVEDAFLKPEYVNFIACVEKENLGQNPPWEW